MIKLGILVVYMVSEGFERLLGIHLDRIRRHTSSDYLIYGAVGRITEECRTALEESADVRLFHFPETDLRGSQEHSWYLERLVEEAIEDGVTHVAILHVDSFPVSDGWDQNLTARLSDACCFVSIEGISTACLVFRSGFYREHRPTFLLSDRERESRSFTEFFESVRPSLHSGIGFGYCAWSAGLTWELLPSTSSVEVEGASVFGDLIFHLEGSFRLASTAGEAAAVASLLGRDRFERLLAAARRLVPEGARLFIRRLFRSSLEAVIDDSRVRWDAERMVRGRDKLFADPDAFVERLVRHGPPRSPVDS